MCVVPINIKIDSPKFKVIKDAIDPGMSDVVSVPCGRCLECRQSHINQWIVRLMEEFKAPTTKSAHFITLTYEDKYITIEDGLVNEYGELTLNYRHHQLYMKKLRKLVNDKSRGIKYFTAGEYGDKTGRPHFHSIIFNVSQDEILKSWHYGNVHFGKVTEASIQYTLKYCLKKSFYMFNELPPLSDTVAPERALMSKGIGLNYLSKFSNKLNYHYAKDKNTLTLNGGHEVALPRYYKDRLFSRLTKGKRSAKNLAELSKLNTPENQAEKKQKALHKFLKYKAKLEKSKIAGLH